MVRPAHAAACSVIVAGAIDDSTGTSPRIAPRRGELTVPGAPEVSIAEIRLGPFPRGAALILYDAESVAGVDDPMNALAQHGFESLAAGLPVATPATKDRILDALVLRLGERNWDHEQIGVLGCGRGGYTVLGAAGRYPFGAAVSVVELGTAEQQDQVARAMSELRTPWLGLTDTSIADRGDGVLDRLKAVSARQTPVYSELIDYRGLTGRFHHSTTDTLSHSAAFDGWQRTIEWLNNRVVPRLTPASLAWRARLPAQCGAP